MSDGNRQPCPKCGALNYLADDICVSCGYDLPPPGKAEAWGPGTRGVGERVPRSAQRLVRRSPRLQGLLRFMARPECRLIAVILGSLLAARIIKDTVEPVEARLAAGFVVISVGLLCVFVLLRRIFGRSSIWDSSEMQGLAFVSTVYEAVSCLTFIGYFLLFLAAVWAVSRMH